MELAPDLVRRAKRLSDDHRQGVVTGAAETILERLRCCTLLGDPIDFDDEDAVLLAAYELGRYDLRDEALELENGVPQGNKS